MAPDSASATALSGDSLDRGGEPLFRAEGGVELLGLERREAVGRDEERRQHDERRERPLRVERRTGPDEGRDGHHRALAVVVDRRVRHLREALSEVRRERAAAAG